MVTKPGKPDGYWIGKKMLEFSGSIRFFQYSFTFLLFAKILVSGTYKYTDIQKLLSIQKMLLIGFKDKCVPI